MTVTARHKSFRKDINGLRALAVIPVLFFHAGCSWFTGGFLGVDVFFVISGYLITDLILKDISNDGFSVIGFYDRRVRRLAPALITVCLLSTICSFFMMLPYDLKNYGQSLVATMLSANNVLLFLTSGYWSHAAEFKPLYHTWSLAVEEQFYLLVPVVLLILTKRKWNNVNVLIASTCILTLCSFTLSVVSEDREFNFLMISHRMWELLAGSLVAIYIRASPVKKNNIFALTGITLILYSYSFPFHISENQALYTLLPILGTVMFIVFSSDSKSSGKLFANKPTQLVGSMSYSIYLVHMPMLAFFRLSSEEEPSTIAEMICVCVSVIVAFPIWRYVENRFRGTAWSAKVFYSTTVALFGLLLLVGFSVHSTYGFQKYSRFDYGDNPQRYVDKPYELSRYSFDRDGKQRILIIGNSFARDFINVLSESDSSNSLDIVYLKKIVNNDNEKELIMSADIIFAVSSAGAGAKDVVGDELMLSTLKLKEYLTEFAAGDVYMVGTKNFGWNNNFVKLKKTSSLSGYRVSVNRSNVIANIIEKSVWKDNYIDIIDAVSDKDGKVPLFTSGGKFISFDGDHLTKAGAKYLAPVIIQRTQLNDLL